jgi:prenyltransferase beta subunit
VESAARSEDKKALGDVIIFLSILKELVGLSSQQVTTKVQLLLLCQAYSGSLGRIDEVLLS